MPKTFIEKTVPTNRAFKMEANDQRVARIFSSGADIYIGYPQGNKIVDSELFTENAVINVDPGVVIELDTRNMSRVDIAEVETMLEGHLAAME